MIAIKIRPWSPIGGVTHSATSYQVSTNIGFTNIVDNNIDDAVNLNVYYSPISIPVGVTYYVRFERKFSDATSSGYSDPIAVTNNPMDPGVLTYEPVKVYKPIVSVDHAELNDPIAANINISSSDFVGVNEGHGYTIWMILNDKNEVLAYDKSEVDLTSKAFARNPDFFLGTKYLKFLVIHGTLTNVESSIGELIVDLTKVNFSLSLTSDVHTDGKDLNVYITRTPFVENNELSKIVLKDVNGVDMWETAVYPADTAVIIPGILFTAGMEYLVVGYGIPATEDYNYTIPVRVRKELVVTTIDPGYVYSKTIRELGASSVLSHSGKFCTREIYSGKFIIPVDSALKWTIQNADGSFSKLSSIVGVSPGAVAIANMFIQEIPGNYLLIDMPTTNGSKLSLYSIDYYNNTIALVTSVSVTWPAVGESGSFIKYNDTTFYAGRDLCTGVHKYTLTGGVLSKITMGIPDGETNIRLITEDAGDNMLVFFEDSGVIYSYNFPTETYVEKYTLPLEFRGRTLAQRKLANGDVVVWKPIREETVGGQLVSDVVMDMLYIDNTNNTLEHIVPAGLRDYDIVGSVMTNSGKLLLTTDAIDANVLVFE